MGHIGKTSGVVISGRWENRSMRSTLLATMLGTMGVFAASSAALAQSADTRIASMPFGECLSIINEAAQEVDEEPVKLVSTSDMVTVRINASDGFVTVSCDRSSNKMTLTKSPVPEAAGRTAAR
jgi:hypothetical protein